MLWWDWNSAQRLKVAGTIFALSALPSFLVFGLLRGEVDTALGVTAFLVIPLIITWFLYVGLRTGRIPVRGGSEVRSESPIWFWLIASMYAGLLAMFLWFGLGVAFGDTIPGF